MWLAARSGRTCLDCRAPGVASRRGYVGKTPGAEARLGRSRWSWWLIGRRCADGREVRVGIESTERLA